MFWTSESGNGLPLVHDAPARQHPLMLSTGICTVVVLAGILVLSTPASLNNVRAVALPQTAVRPQLQRVVVQKRRNFPQLGSIQGYFVPNEMLTGIEENQVHQPSHFKAWMDALVTTLPLALAFLAGLWAFVHRVASSRQMHIHAEQPKSQHVLAGLTMAAISGNTESFSASPGTLEKEPQPVVTPLDNTSSVLVVGGTRGLGLEFVKQLLKKGCKVVATHREAQPPADLAALSDFGPLKTLQLDVADEATIQKASALADAEQMTFTHIIHNAGVYGEDGAFGGPERATKDEMMSVFEVNSVGPLLVAQYFSPFLKANGSCKLPILSILTSKMGSVDDNTSGGSYAYRASKAACNIVAKSLYVDLRSERKATVCLLHPGYVRTAMTDFEGLIDTDESVAGMLRAIEATGPETPFRWVDYKACRIPW